MTIDMFNSSTEILNTDDDVILNDDIFDKPTNKTLRNYYNGAGTNETFVHTMREYCNSIPTTDVDSLLPLAYILMSNAYKVSGNRYWGKSFPLRHREMYDTFIDALEKDYISKKCIYNKRTGFEQFEYTIQTTGYIDFASLYKNDDDIYNPIACPKKDYKNQSLPNKTCRKIKFRSWRAYNTQKEVDNKINYIYINNNKYSVNNVYKCNGTDFVPVIIHKKANTPILNIDEVFIRNHCSVNVAVNVNFTKDTTLSGLVLNPEPMKFENIYEDFNENFKKNIKNIKNIKNNNDKKRYQRNRSTRQNKRRFIRCMINDPGFITKFELYYRSSQTNGLWIKYNICNGNVSNHEPTKIVFDDLIIARQIRIVPLSHYKSFEKVIVEFFANKIPIDNDANGSVTYIVNTPRNIRGIYSYEQDVLSNSKIERRNTKGDKKKKYREFNELCNM